MTVFVENERGSTTRTRFDENTFTLKESFEVNHPYPYPYGFIPNTNARQADCIDCYVVTLRPLHSGSFIECEPIGMIEMIEDGEIDHKVLMGFGDEPIPDLMQVGNEIMAFIENIFKKLDDVAIHWGKLLPKEDAKSYIQHCV